MSNGRPPRSGTPAKAPSRRQATRGRPDRARAAAHDPLEPLFRAPARRLTRRFSAAGREGGGVPRASAAGRRAAAVALLALTVGGGLVAGDEATSPGSDSVPASLTRPQDLPERSTDRVSRAGRPTPRDGRVPEPNAVTRGAPRPDPPPWVRPARRYRISSGYGHRWGTLHAGVDLAGSSGSAIRAVRAGTVGTARWYGGYGYAVIIKHGNGVRTLYGHNSRLLVRKGQRVRTGQRIALMGSTGYSTGTHLHFEVHLGGDPVDPVPWMRRHGVRL